MGSSAEDASPMSRFPLAAFLLCSVLLPGLGHASDTPACASTQEVTRIEKDLVVVGKDVSIHACDHVLGDVVVIVGDATVAGRVDGDVVVVFGDLQLDSHARVAGDAVVTGGTLQMSPTANVLGDTGHVPEASSSARSVAGRLTGAASGSSEMQGVTLDLDSERQLSNPLAEQPVWLRIATALLASLLLFIVGHFFLWIAPERARNLRRTIEASPGTSLIMGGVISLALILLSVLLFISIIGWIALPFVGLGAALLTALGMAGLLEALGDRLPLPVRLRSRSSDLIAGAVLLSSLSCLSAAGGTLGVIAGLVIGGMLCAAVGASVLSSLGGRAYS